MGRRLAIPIALWAVVVCAGFVALWRYANTPAFAGTPDARVTDAAAVGLDPDLPTLVLFVHPRCPCTSATVEQVARLQRRHADGLAIRAVVYRPEGEAPGWAGGAVTSGLSRLPGCRLIDDPGGAISARFGASNSGLAALYRPDGGLVFWGGLTPSRGHAGDSVGVDALEALLGGAPAGSWRAPVFGCSLESPVCAASLAREGGGHDR